MKSSILKFFAIDKKVPIQTTMTKIKYRDINCQYNICYGTICWINHEQSLLFVYQEQNPTATNSTYRIGYIDDEDIDQFKKKSFNQINYKMKSKTWELKIVQQLQRKGDQINIYLPKSLKSNMNIKFHTGQLAQEWYLLLINMQNIERKRVQKNKEEKQKQRISEVQTSQIEIQQLKQEQIQGNIEQNSSLSAAPRISQDYGQMLTNVYNQQISQSILNCLWQEDLGMDGKQ